MREAYELVHAFVAPLFGLLPEGGPRSFLELRPAVIQVSR